MARLTSLLLIAALACAATVCMADDSDKVLKLGAGDFSDKVGDGSVYFIKFFAPWCGHCKRLAPTWGELADSYDGNESVKIASVDCTVHRDVCSTADIKGYPTLKVYHSGEAWKESYRGARDLDSLKAYVDEAVESLLGETTE